MKEAKSRGVGPRKRISFRGAGPFQWVGPAQCSVVWAIGLALLLLSVCPFVWPAKNLWRRGHLRIWAGRDGDRRQARWFAVYWDTQRVLSGFCLLSDHNTAGASPFNSSIWRFKGTSGGIKAGLCWWRKVNQAQAASSSLFYANWFFTFEFCQLIFPVCQEYKGTDEGCPLELTPPPPFIISLFKIETSEGWTPVFLASLKFIPVLQESPLTHSFQASFATFPALLLKFSLSWSLLLDKNPLLLALWENSDSASWGHPYVVSIFVATLQPYEAWLGLRFV